MEKLKRIVSEIIDKECERYRLLHLGLMQVEPKDIADKISLDIYGKESFYALYTHIKDVLYNHLGYKSFIERQKAKHVNNNIFTNSVKDILKLELAYLQKENPITKLDIELRTDKRISFYLSSLLFFDIYKTFSQSHQTFKNPSDLNKYFLLLIHEIYPIDFDRFLILLKRKDEDFWIRGVYNLLIKIAKDVTNKNIWSSTYRDITKDEIATESYLELNNIIANKDIPFADASHFRKYAYSVCINKMHEYRRKNTIDSITDNIEEDLKIADVENETITEPETIYMEIDVNNEYQLAQLAAIILLNKTHPLHQRLVGSDGKKVDLLIDISVNNLSYDEIIEERTQGLALSLLEQKRLNINLRQEYLRIKKTIIKRLETILEDNEKMYPFRR